MLHYLRTGARNPSPKVLRRIMELEVESGLVVPPTHPIAVRESHPVYSTNVHTKQLDIVELRCKIAELDRLSVELKQMIGDL
jgi:hypothetical protein